MNPTRRSAQPPATVDPTQAPAFLADVPDSVLFCPSQRSKQHAWTTRHRDYFLRRNGVAPSLYDVEAERTRRRFARRKVTPQPVARRTDVEPLPMLPRPASLPVPVNMADVLGTSFIGDDISRPVAERRPDRHKRRGLAERVARPPDEEPRSLDHRGCGAFSSFRTLQSRRYSYCARRGGSGLVGQDSAKKSSSMRLTSCLSRTSTPTFLRTISAASRCPSMRTSRLCTRSTYAFASGVNEDVVMKMPRSARAPLSAPTNA